MSVFMHISEIAGGWFVVLFLAALLALAMFALTDPRDVHAGDVPDTNVSDDRRDGVRPSETSRPGFTSHPPKVNPGPASKSSGRWYGDPSMLAQPTTASSRPEPQ
jgi:hypothetical protein